MPVSTLGTLEGETNPRSCVSMMGIQGDKGPYVFEGEDVKGEGRLSVRHRRGLIMTKRDRRINNSFNLTT